MLKSLELFGFKSFADRTKFDFSTGITAVVGPNGSGKSNVVDGIKWILGDQSPKSLRGKEMTDVIFNGAANRKAASLSEATLVFDNESGFLPVESREVHVGRRLWRNGDSEYLLNGTPVRLKDIRRLLMGSDAGSAAYAIIEQGRVDQILQANAVSRRAIFEEAAGISLYKTRRAEFVRRMERVDQMLARLTDIVDEVESQRSALRSQAEKAATYREVSEQLKRAWLGLAADDYRQLTGTLEASTEIIEADRQQIEQLGEERNRLEQQLEQIDHELADADRRLRDKDREISALREDIAGHLSTIRLQTGRSDEQHFELLRLKRQRFRLEDQLRESHGELTHLQSVLDDSEANCHRLQQQIEQFNTQIEESEQLAATQRNLQTEHDEKIELCKQQQAELQDGVNRLKTDLRATQTTLQSNEERKQTLAAQHESAVEQAESSRREWQEAELRLKAAEAAHAAVKDERETLLAQLAEHRTALAELREQRSAGEARAAVLQDLESRQEGLGIGVKEILRRAETSEYAPWNQIAGTVADLIDVDLADAALLEAALGPRAQLIVIDGYADLREYLSVHSSQISGRVGFIECGRRRLEDAPTEVESKESDGPESKTWQFRNAALTDLSGQPGVVKRAEKLARGLKGFEDLPAEILADTWLVETLDDAFALADGAGRGCRFITLQGEVLEPSGTLTVGTLRSETAVVSRKSELRRLKNDLIRLGSRLDQEERRLAETNEKLADIDQRMKSTATEAESLRAEQAEKKSAHAADQREIERLDQSCAKLRDEIAELQESLEGFTAEITEREEQLAAINEERESLQKETGRIAESLANHVQERNTIQTQRDAEQLEFAKHAERKTNLEESLRRAQQDLSSRQHQLQESTQRLEAARIKRRDVELAILHARSELAELSVAEESRAVEAEQLAIAKDEIRARRVKLSQEETALRKEITKLQERVHRTELEIREARQRLETHEERLSEEYQVELAEVVESGVSAFADYLAERAPAEDVTQAGDVDPDDDELAEDESWDEPVRESEPEPEIQFEDVREELEANVDRLRRKLKAIGAVNTDSLRDLDEIETRAEHLSSTLEDLTEAKSHLEDLVRKIDQKCKQLFRETFDIIRENFQQLFRKAFGGGDGDIVLEDADDVLECGIDVVARPPGKELKSISLLSGGEKTLTAFALLLAMFRYRPSPYCVLDEVDAALDEANVERLLALLQEFKHNTQFVIITHKKPTMTIADVLYGVTMEESGVSKRLNVKFDNIGENGEFVADGSDDATTSAA